jgi:N-acetylmuramoyl-L-alanine amidase
MAGAGCYKKICRFCRLLLVPAAAALFCFIAASTAKEFHVRHKPVPKVALENASDRVEKSTIVASGLSVISNAPDEVSLILDVSEQIAIFPSALTEPNRLVFDLPKTAFLTKPGNARPAGFVTDSRYGLFIAGTSRIILDLSEPAAVERIDAIKTDIGMRMVVTMRRTTPEHFARSVQEGIDGFEKVGTVKKPIPARYDSKVLHAEEPKGELPLVIIDPGHGGIDAGAIGPNGEMEKNLVLAIGQKLKARLEAGGKVRVEMTRDGDLFVPLTDRVRIARDRAAALFISLHADTLTEEPNVRGATVYTLSDRASDAMAARLAEKENKADQAAGVAPAEDQESVSDILFDLAKRETRQFSLGFAKKLIASLQGPTQINKNPHRFARFMVLKAPDIPSVLLELGYLSSPDDARQLTSPEWQDKIANAAGDAVERFILTRGRERVDAE